MLPKVVVFINIFNGVTSTVQCFQYMFDVLRASVIFFVVCDNAVFVLNKLPSVIHLQRDIIIHQCNLFLNIELKDILYQHFSSWNIYLQRKVEIEKRIILTCTYMFMSSYTFLVGYFDDQYDHLHAGLVKKLQ